MRPFVAILPSITYSDVRLSDVSGSETRDPTQPIVSLK